MKAALFETFGGPVQVTDLERPEPPADGALIRVEANGICRSDWHAWKGHDSTVSVPHVPGHEMAGVIEAVGEQVSGWTTGDRVTAPFCCGCGSCGHCRSGHQNLCDHPYQTGFAGWGSFAEFVVIPKADVNLVPIPEAVTAVQAASLGCRFATAYHALTDLAHLRPGESVAVYGCGGLGLSVIMIAAAMGARPIAVDIRTDALVLARDLGADAVVDASAEDRPSGAVAALTRGGAHVAVDALGSRETCINALMSLRKRGRHVQAGLMLAEERKVTLPMGRVINWELSLHGCFGLAGGGYADLLAMIEAGRIDPGRLVTGEVDLETGCEVLTGMDRDPPTGVTVITSFG